METRDERLRRYRSALDRAMNADSPETRKQYESVRLEAWNRRECLLCAEQMDHPSLHQRVREGDHAPMGPEFLAHHECFRRLHEEQGWATTSIEPVGVDEDGALKSLTAFEPRDERP
jgi:hypothetical protein